MRRAADSSYERYVGSKFTDTQSVTLPRRRVLLPTLGLREGDERWFEMPVKENLSSFAHFDEVRAVQNLLIVHYIDIKGEEVPPHILASVRGTIIYEAGAKYFIIRKSIPYTRDIVMDKLQKDGEKYVFTLPGEKIKVSPQSLKIVPYIEGTVIDIMKVDGVVQWFTSHNVLPKGVRREGRNVYKKSRWGHHNAFTDDFENIITVCAPGLLNMNDELFPANCKLSNKLYRFVLLTRERVRAEATPISSRGVLIYLGCQTQFKYSDYPELEPYFGEKHEGEYKFKTETFIPLEDRPAIVRFPETFTPEQADRYLAGSHPELGVLSGGGKLVVTARVAGVGATQTHIFHVKSRAYEYRESILGNSPDLYKEFLSLLDLQRYDFTDSASIVNYFRDFPAVELPVTREQVLALRDKIERMEEIVPTLVEVDSDSMPSRPVTQIWYLFLMCANLSIRERVMRYAERYAFDRAFLQRWMFRLGSKEPFVARGDTDKDQKKANRDRISIFTFKTEILRHELYDRGRGADTVMLLLGDRTASAIAIARRQTGTTEESISISEPEILEELKGRTASAREEEIQRAIEQEENHWNEDRPLVASGSSSQASSTLEEERLLEWD